MPDEFVSLADIGPYLEDIAAYYELPVGAELRDVDRETDSGSISITLPRAWNDLDLAAPVAVGEDEDETTTGDVLIAAADQSRLYDFQSGGIFIGVTPAGTNLPDSGIQQYLDEGCVSSPKIEVDEPIPGEVRIWAGCTDDRMFVVALMASDDAEAQIFALATSAPEAAALAVAFDTLRIDTDSISDQPGS